MVVRGGVILGGPFGGVRVRRLALFFSGVEVHGKRVSVNVLDLMILYE